MISAVYFNGKYEDVVLVAAFLMRSDAEDYVEKSFLDDLKIKELSHNEAWQHFQSIRAEVQ